MTLTAFPLFHLHHTLIHPPTEPSIHPSLHLSFIVTASASPPPSLPSVSSGAQWPLPFHLHLLPPSRWGTPRLAVPRECSASLWTRAIGTTSWASSPGGWAGSSPWWCPFPRRAPACPCRRRCSLQSERGGQAGVGKPQRRLRVPAPPGWGSRCAHNPVLTNSNGHTHTHTCAHCQTLHVLLNLLGPVLCFVFLGWDLPPLFSLLLVFPCILQSVTPGKRQTRLAVTRFSGAATLTSCDAPKFVCLLPAAWKTDWETD